MRLGNARWQAFKRKKLVFYHQNRNDAAKAQTVSRLSAYLHYGMLSATTLAREAWVLGGEGAEKYLDELITWRDLAYQFCYHQRNLSFRKALPPWAQETLYKHAQDRQPPKNLEDLLRAQSGDALWDAAQTSLLWHGALHNNLRMTWGKALVTWAPSSESALDWLLELNHRLALDGSDPNSYGGILWCLGQFDKPFTPPQPILGTVRPRPTLTHLAHLDLSAYEAWLKPHALHPKPKQRWAVIGAGLIKAFCGGSFSMGCPRFSSIAALARQQDTWQLQSESGAKMGGFAGVLLAVLPVEAEALLKSHYP